MNAPIKGTPPWFLESSLSFCLVQGLVPTEIKKFQTADHNAVQVYISNLSVWVHSLGVIRIRMIIMYSTPLVGIHFKITDSLNPPWTWITWITDLLYSIGMGFEFHHSAQHFFPTLKHTEISCLLS